MIQEIVLFGKTIDRFSLYPMINNIGHIFMFLWLIINIKEYNSFSVLPNLASAKIKNQCSGRVASWAIAFVELLLMFAVMLVSAKPIANGISVVFLGAESDNYFYNIFALPLILMLIAIIFQFSPLRFTDFVAPANALVLIFYKIACYCFGCCFGVETEKFGMYNACTERVEFPVQLVEIICAVIMFIVLLVVRHKKNHKPGILFPLFMLMYCGSRFISEFWRDDYPTVLGQLKGYHIQCIVGFVEGLILLFVVLKFGERITEFYAGKRQRVLERKSAEKTEEKASEE
ncbi:MAG: prolipoprotein diacylglyceryl transferase [Ruminococcaceae bacterium]|nr:prolipoprotein diacylglyceryl transferase [Oscillospiraceae bacterium]